MSDQLTIEIAMETLRKRGVAIGNTARRNELAAVAVGFGPSVEAWELVDGYLLARFWKDADKLSGGWLGALKSPEAFGDLLVAAAAHRDEQIEREAARDPGAYRREDCKVASTRPPIALCFCPDPMREVLEEPLGAPIGQWFDPTDSTPELQGRWFCRRCGREWVATPHGTAGFRTTSTPFGGAPDMSVGLRPYTPPAKPESAKRNVKQA